MACRPPFAVQFAATAEIVDPRDPEIARLVGRGALKSITGHGELDLAGGCFIRITPGRKLHTYGFGISLRQLLRDPLDAGGSVDNA